MKAGYDMPLQGIGFIAAVAVGYAAIKRYWGLIQAPADVDLIVMDGSVHYRSPWTSRLTGDRRANAYAATSIVLVTLVAYSADQASENGWSVGVIYFALIGLLVLLSSLKETFVAPSDHPDHSDHDADEPPEPYSSPFI